MTLDCGEFGVSDRIAEEGDGDAPVGEALMIEREQGFDTPLQPQTRSLGRFDALNLPGGDPLEGRKNEVTHVSEVGADDGPARAGLGRQATHGEGMQSLASHDPGGQFGDLVTSLRTVDEYGHGPIVLRGCSTA